MNKKLKIGRITVPITHPERILFPGDRIAGDGITKGELIDYYHRIAPVMLPHMKGRPVTMHRFPDGITHEGFYHKDAPDYFPAWIKRVRVPKEGGFVHHVLCSNAATLVYMANHACITPHVWLSHAPKIHFPDRMIIDLDPSNNQFSLAQATALQLKELLEFIGLVPFVMTTGSRGLHVVVPLKPTATFDEVRAFARDIAMHLAAQNPTQLTTEIRKEKRRGRLFLDVARNAYAQTGVCAYAVRAKSGAPVATPLEWKEVADKELTAQRYTIKNVFKRLEKMGGDPWKNINRYARTITSAQKRLKALLVKKKR